VTQPTRCRQCGSRSSGAGPPGLCPACLLGLAVDAGAGADLEDDEPDLAGPPCRVVTVLSAEDDRTTYLAEDVETRRLVTLDVVRLPQDGRDEALRQCRARLRSLLRWSHPGVPRVIGGEISPSGDFCVVSHYVKGQRLDRYCDEQQVDAAGRARLFAFVRAIVASGHRSGVCHGRLRQDLVMVFGSSRDPKPVVLGYSVTPGRTPSADDDAAGLDAVARELRIST
jgi:serine/threonine-protein kinase